MRIRGKTRVVLYGGVGLLAGLGLAFVSRAMGAT
jgi:hypothetical protein